MHSLEYSNKYVHNCGHLLLFPFNLEPTSSQKRHEHGKTLRQDTHINKLILNYRLTLKTSSPHKGFLKMINVWQFFLKDCMFS